MVRIASTVDMGCEGCRALMLGVEKGRLCWCQCGMPGGPNAGVSQVVELAHACSGAALNCSTGHSQRLQGGGLAGSTVKCIPEQRKCIAQDDCHRHHAHPRARGEKQHPPSVTCIPQSEARNEPAYCMLGMQTSIVWAS